MEEGQMKIEIEIVTNGPYCIADSDIECPCLLENHLGHRYSCAVFNLGDRCNYGPRDVPKRWKECLNAEVEE
jgi:hypothetical protein